MWPKSLMSVITLETSRYGQQKRHPNWVDVTTDETRTLLGILIPMGILRLLRIIFFGTQYYNITWLTMKT